MAQITDRQKDSEILARLIYMAFVAPERANINIGDVSFVPFAAALELYARTRESENREEESRRSLLRMAAEAGVKMPEETASKSDVPPEPEPEPADTHTHTHTAGANDGGGGQPGTFAGKGSGEKRIIFEHLTTFIAAHGAGARKKIADASNGALTINELFEMCAARPYPLAKWRVAEAAMKYLEQKEGNNAAEKV